VVTYLKVRSLPARVPGKRFGSRRLCYCGQPESGALLRNVGAADARERSQARRTPNRNAY
jgi:hypothetical protein